MPVSHPPLPLVLAGPILRRIEPQHLALWLVVTQKVELCFHAKSNGTDLQNFTAPAVKCLTAGENLHFLMLDLHFDKALPHDCWIDYSLHLKTLEGEDSNWQDIVDLCPNLLYEGRTTLGFKLPKHVKAVLHGSCRKPHHASGDGLVTADLWLQDQIVAETQVQEQANWPSLLVMSGDQIYADDVAAPMLRAIHSVITKLGLAPEDFTGLKLPHFEDSQALYDHEKCYYGRAELLPQVEENRALIDILFEGVKKPVFTTDTASNHLISLHENLLMYIMVWAPQAWEIADMEAPSQLSGQKRTAYNEEKVILKDFVTGLKHVQRLFAHLPIAMIFDDHDITDDWNLNRQWEQAVYGHPFSTRMIGNSLCAYFICQGWGNDPSHFNDDFLERMQGALSRPGHKEHRDFVDAILGFEGWEYQWPCDPPLIVIDTRTRRWRSESSMVKPSGLLDWEALGDLQQKLYGNSSVLLVSPAPIYGVKVIETIQRIFTWLGKPLMVDAENWMAHPGTANSILNVFLHSKTPQNFIILSGDVHYSFVYDVELRGRKGGPDIWQVTSSGFKNEFPKKLLNILDIANRWLYSPRSPLNWFTKRKRMRVIPRKPEGNADGRRVLNGAGVGLVELDENGKPVHFCQLLADGRQIAFPQRMEGHSRWQ